jgi:DnaK suppressor protein
MKFAIQERDTMKKKTASKKSPSSKQSAVAKVPAAPKFNTVSIRKELLAMRDDLIKTVRKQQISESAMQDTGDSVDEASRSIEKELLFELSDNERVNLDQIEASLRKIDKGTYGLCESCRKPIAKARLNALPFARYCIDCQSSSETAPDLIEQAPEFRGIGAAAEETGGFER